MPTDAGDTRCHSPRGGKYARACCAASDAAAETMSSWARKRARAACRKGMRVLILTLVERVGRLQLPGPWNHGALHRASPLASIRAVPRRRPTVRVKGSTRL